MTLPNIVVYAVGVQHLLLFVGGYTYVGCYIDNEARVLNGTNMIDIAMTVELCLEFCCNNTEEYAGLEYSKECYCGNVQLTDYLRSNEQDCKNECSGESEAVCGGPWRLSIYQTEEECRVERTEPLLNNSTTSYTTQEPISNTNSCHCQCPAMTSADTGNKSSFRSLEDIMPEVSRLQKELRVDKKKTKSFSRRKKCQPDARASSKYIGVVASIIIVTPFALAIIADLLK